MYNVNCMIFKNMINSKFIGLLVMLLSFSCFESALAVQFKCKDKNGNVTYSDVRCPIHTRQELNVITVPVDKPSAERLEFYKNYNSSTSSTRKDNSSVITIEAEKPDQTCERYAQQMKRLKQSLNSGYEPERGESLRNSIKSVSRNYNDCMNR